MQFQLVGYFTNLTYVTKNIFYIWCFVDYLNLICGLKKNNHMLWLFYDFFLF